MNEALEIIKNKAVKTVWDKRNGSVRILDKSDICPISGKWLIPANCTEKKPPQIEEGYKVSFQNGQWITEKTDEQIESELAKVQGSAIISLQDQIQELKKQIEELKFEKEEVKLDMKLEKEKLLDEIANARAEALELSTNLILQTSKKKN